MSTAGADDVTNEVTDVSVCINDGSGGSERVSERVCSPWSNETDAAAVVVRAFRENSLLVH